MSGDLHMGSRPLVWEPRVLNKTCVSMYADDSTIYVSVTTANEVTETLNKELQSVLECVASNKLVLDVSKTILNKNKNATG